MGSTKLQIPAAVWWWLAILLLSVLPMNASEMSFPTEFPDTAAIDKWAGSSFLGGFEKHTFTHGDKSVLAVIGMPTSGVATSEIALLERRKNGAYTLILVRQKMFGIVTVKDADDAIVFSLRTPILVIPWAGVAVSMQK